MKIGKKGKQFFAALISIALIITSTPLGAVTANAVTTQFAGGSGIQDDPYLIEKKEHLNNVRNELDAHYKLIADIVFTDADFAKGGDFYNNGKGWTPLGEVYSAPFNGTFDGNGFAIIGLFVKAANYHGSVSGLFGINNGTIMNLAVVNGSVTDTSSGYTYVGGIAGSNAGVISNCYNSMTVSTMTYGGGIAGQNSGLITDCYNIGNITKAQNYGTYSGGIVGYNFIDATISSCYNAGGVIANQKGGLVGENRGTISHCYFLESEQKGCAVGTAGGYRCSIAELQTKSTFEGFNFDTIWEFVNDSDYLFPVLKDVKHIPIDNNANNEDFAGGTGSLIYPYLISNVSQLANIQKFPDLCFKLTNDIVFTVDDNSNWSSIGTASRPFAGYFDGDGYSIKGLTKSLFNYNTGVVKNIALKDAVVTDAATIILNNRGVLSNCYSSSEISFSSTEKMSVGGLVSKNYATIKNCFYNGKIKATTTFPTGYTGGIVGSNDSGTISSCYNLGIISTNTSRDGIVGENNNATMKNNYYYEFFALGYYSTQNGGVKATVDQLKTKDFFVGFNFDSEWQIDATLGYPAPTLKIMRAAPDVRPQNTTDFAGGNGDVFSPYLISNIEHLSKVSSYANLRCHFMLIDDIVLNETFEKSMISSFNGMLNGEMHTISGFTTKSATVDNGYVGFIGTNNGVIKNLKFKDCNIEFSKVNESYVGVVAGYNNGILSNLDVETKIFCNNVIADDSSIGGVVGATGGNSVIEDVQTTGIIDIPSATRIYEINIGGIIGQGCGKIVNAINDIDITVNSYVSPVEIYKSHFGGIIGYSSGSTKQNLRNQGNINIYANNEEAGFRINVGGVVGTESAGSTTFASNLGDIFVKAVTAKYSPVVTIGGIVGRDFRRSATIRKSYNTGNISALMDERSVSLGGIIGYGPYLVEDCYNTGKIGGTTSNGGPGPFVAGGIAGYGEPTTTSAIKRCYNIGEISAETAGGIIGDRYGMNIYNCYYTTANKGVGDGSQSNTYRLTSQQLAKASSLSAFDFNLVWTIDANGDYRFPTLRNFPHVCVEHTCTSNTGDKKFNASQHWEYCVFCGKEIDCQDHSFNCICDESCNGCEYIREIKDVANNEWNSDDHKHWKTCLECNTQVNSDTHIYKTGESLSCSVCDKSRTITSISIANLPTKRQYIRGEELDLSDLTVVAYYNNDTSGTVKSYTVSGYSSTPGSKTITVTYSGKTTSFTVNVVAESVTHIIVTTKPIKLTYLEGELFNKERMVVTAYYNNNTSAVVTDYTVSGYTSTPGTKTITVSYGGKTATFTVVVKAKTVTSIAVTDKPNKLTYLEGDSFNKTGMVVTAYYNNNTSAAITDYTVSGYTSTPGTKTITVSYGGKTATFTVTVNAKALTSIAVTKQPNKLTYLEGDSFNKTGMVVTAYYNNNTSAAVTDYTVSGYTSTPGTKTITVSYSGKTATFTVTVTSKAPSVITSSKHTVSGKNISKITAGTTVSSLLSGLKEGSYCKVYKGKDIVSGNAAVGTGMVVKIMDGNTVKASYTVIVTGDTNGDGAISVTDMIAIKAHLLKKSTLSGAAATAADTNGDNGISITDFIQVKAKILGKGSIVAR